MVILKPQKYFSLWESYTSRLSKVLQISPGCCLVPLLWLLGIPRLCFSYPCQWGASPVTEVSEKPWVRSFKCNWDWELNSKMHGSKLGQNICTYRIMYLSSYNLNRDTYTHTYIQVPVSYLSQTFTVVSSGMILYFGDLVGFKISLYRKCFKTCSLCLFCHGGVHFLRLRLGCQPDRPPRWLWDLLKEVWVVLSCLCHHRCVVLNFCWRSCLKHISLHKIAVIRNKI